MKMKVVKGFFANLEGNYQLNVINMMKLPSSIVCPHCKSEIKLASDGKGMLSTDNLLTMRIKSPFYVHAQKSTEISLEVSVCSQCNTIIGINRKSM